MRLIDADELINKLNKFESDVHGSAECYSSVTEITEAIEYVGILIDETPTVEAVPVVRCKDCKYFCDGYPNVLNADGLCENTDCLVDLYCFCSYGERKENEIN